MIGDSMDFLKTKERQEKELFHKMKEKFEPDTATIPIEEYAELNAYKNEYEHIKNSMNVSIFDQYITEDLDGRNEWKENFIKDYKERGIK